MFEELKEKFNHASTWRIERYENDDAYAARRPYDISEFHGNLLLVEGIAEMFLLLCSTGGTLYNNANAYLGVGNSSTGEMDSDTGLLGASKLYKGMEATYPQISSKTFTWRSVFTDGEAEFAWEEFTVCNSNSDAGDNLNRKTSSQGTKSAGQTWTLDLDIAWS